MLSTVLSIWLVSLVRIEKHALSEERFSQSWSRSLIFLQKTTKMLKKVNLLLILDNLVVGGAEILVLDFCRKIDRDKYNVTLCALGDGALRCEFEQIGYKPLIFERRRRIDFLLIFNLMKLMKRKRVNIIHAHLGMPTIYGSIAGLFAGVRTIFSSWHRSDKSKNEYIVKKRIKFVYKLLSPFITKFVAVSQEVKSFLINKMGIDKRKIAVIYNGIDFTRMMPDKGEIINLLEEFTVSLDTFKVSMVARLCDAKDYPTFISASKIVLSQIPNSVFFIIGDGPQRSQLEMYAKDIGVGEKIIFTGFRRDIPKFLSCSNVFVLSTNSEAFGMVLLEAMIAGIPIVATALPAIREIIKNGETGILVPPKDPDSLAAAIVTLYHDKGLTQTLPKNAKISVKGFSIEENIRKTTKLYQQYLFRYGRN